jgi:CRP/FNR family cyclic AMP-dependent transcriptional regulator
MHAPKSNPAVTLRRLPLFNDLSEAELALIGERVTIHLYDAGMIVFSEGDVCRELWIVKEGTVKILKTAPSGRQQLIGIERAGNSLSEVPVFDGGCYLATAQAVSSTVLLRLEADHFRRICLQYPEVALKVIKVLGHRLRSMSSLIEDLSFTTVRGRLVAHLLRVAEQDGRRTSRGIEFELTENNEELAARLGTVRELVSRNLGRLHGEGWIEIRRRTVTIPNLSKLKEEAAGTAQ